MEGWATRTNVLLVSSCAFGRALSFDMAGRTNYGRTVPIFLLGPGRSTIWLPLRQKAHLCGTALDPDSSSLQPARRTCADERYMTAYLVAMSCHG